LVGFRHPALEAADAVKIPGADTGAGIMDFQRPDDFAGGVAQSPIVRVGIERDLGLEGVVVELSLNPKIALVVDGEEGLAGRVRQVSWRGWRSFWGDSFVRKSPGGNPEERE
jgi:hypothetical protein